MYFIQTGYIEILSDTNKSIIYMSKGVYFGEIGVLLTGKRTVNVKSQTNSVVFYVLKADLLEILRKFPEQHQFLLAVA
jgi:CRP-like cAMP-binding protein